MMSEYLPVLVDLNPNKNKQMSETILNDIFFIDKKGVKHEPELVNAVLNGIEIDTSTFYAENERVKKDTIDI